MQAELIHRRTRIGRDVSTMQIGILDEDAFLD
jgi:hypothetical protein